MDQHSTLIPIEQFIFIKAFSIHNFSYHLHPRILWLSLISFNLPYVDKLLQLN